MKLSWFGRLALALFASLALGLGMSACGGGTIAYLWVLGQQYNQISAFKVDDFTGNLTQTPHQPFASQGVNPVTLLVKAGGRFIYVLNEGTQPSSCSNPATCNIKWTSSGVSYFSVGGDGSLTYQQSYQSQGFDPIWMQFDSTNGFLYVLDKYSQSGNGNGSITAYSLGAGGQLVNVTTGKIATSATNISSINGNGSYVILTDSGNNTILPYSIASSCGLSLTLGGVTSNAPGTSNPTYSFISSNNKFLYILNQSTTSTGVTTAYSSITGFLIQPGQSLTQTVGSPYQTSASPVCMVGDPTNRYVYISSHDPGVVTGKLYDATTGTLAELPRGSSFTSAGLGTCLAISGAVD